jgi:arylformamidase
MLTWPGDPEVQVVKTMDVCCGEAATVSQLHLGTHTGTHVDAPNHFLPGAPGVDDMDLSVYIGPACVVEILDTDIDATGGILPNALQEKIEHYPGTLPVRVLLKTGNSRQAASDTPWHTKPFHTEFEHLTPLAAEVLLNAGVRLVGVDYLSVDGYHTPPEALDSDKPDGQKLPPVHKRLLQAGVHIVEGLNLQDVPAGAYELICLPLRIAGADGSPARVVLRAS